MCLQADIRNEIQTCTEEDNRQTKEHPDIYESIKETKQFFFNIELQKKHSRVVP